MSDYSITAASVEKTGNTRFGTGYAGVTITAGQAVYKDAADSLIKLADSDSTLALATAVGISMHAALAGQPISYATGGSIDLGTTGNVGHPACVSNTAGGICPYADIGTADFTTFLGYFSAADNFVVDIWTLSVAKAA